jgi:FlaG/FlaF family flagellin (archaellin)
MQLKGISPLVATVLLISLVVAIAGIVSQWSTIFAKEQTEIVTEQSKTSITCSYGNINMKDLRFQTAQSRLSGSLENIGQIALGNLTLSIVYQNASSQNVRLCNDPSGSISCSVANLSLSVAERVGFNVSIWGSNYDSIKVSTNCTGVTDSASRGDVS